MSWQATWDRSLDRKEHARKHGDDMPEIRGWRWGLKGVTGAQRTLTEGDNV